MTGEATGRSTRTAKRATGSTAATVAGSGPPAGTRAWRVGRHR